MFDRLVVRRHNGRFEFQISGPDAPSPLTLFASSDAPDLWAAAEDAIEVGQMWAAQVAAAEKQRQEQGK